MTRFLAIFKGEIQPAAQPAEVTKGHFDWLRDNVWTQASLWTTDELARRATGEALNPAHFRAHLEARYLG